MSNSPQFTANRWEILVRQERKNWREMDLSMCLTKFRHRIEGKHFEIGQEI